MLDNMKTLTPLFAAMLLLFGCASEPNSYVPHGENATIEAIDETRLAVLQDAKYNCASNGYFFPEGIYVPVAKDENGTFYQSPREIHVRVGVTYWESTPYGGIYVKHVVKNGLPTFLVWYDKTEIRKTDTPIRDMKGPNPDEIFAIRE
jgi:hypothetical protein